MKMRLAFILCIITSLANAASDSAQSYTAVRISKPIKIDGVLDDEEWSKANVISNFTMSRPNEGGKPTQKQEVRVVYDNDALYVGAMMYDDSPDSIRHEMGNRDSDLNADLFRFLIDTYNKRQDAYEFSVYASGVQNDSKFSDPTFDAVWHSDVKITKEGWCVEMEIPYSAIRFPKAKEQVWAMQTTRLIKRKAEFDQWSLTPSNKGNAQLFWGELKGIHDIEPPLRLSFTPYLSTYVAQTPNFNSDGTYNYTKSLSYNAGADVKYGIDERFTIDMTLLPDFGQVQSDSKVKNLSYREITFAENRPFFREGTELFNKANLFYSRRIGKIPSGFYNLPYTLNAGEKIINNPSQVQLINATKLSGRTDRGLGIGLFNAVTAETKAQVEDSLGNKRDITTEPLANYNIVVFDQQLKNNSSFYLINTNVTRDSKTARNANVTGAGATVSNKSNSYAVDVSGALSQLFNHIDSINDFKNTTGYTTSVGFRKTSGRFQMGLRHDAFNNTFNSSDLGFQQINNWHGLTTTLTYYQFLPGKIFRAMNVSTNLVYTENFITRARTDMHIDVNSFATFNNFISVFAGGGLTPISSIDYNEARIPGHIYLTPQFYYAYAGFHTDVRKKVWFYFGINEANFFHDNPNKLLDFPGYGGDTELRFRFSDRFSLGYKYSYGFDPFNVGYTAMNDQTGDVIFGARATTTHVNNLTGKYVFKNNMSLSLTTRHYWFTADYKKYYSLLADGYLTEDASINDIYSSSYNVFNVDLAYSWFFAPGSLFSVVYKNAIETNNDLRSAPYSFNKNFDHTLSSPQTNSLSVRLLYYFDYQYLRKGKIV